MVSRFWHKMKCPGLPFCLLSAVFYLFWTPSAGLKTLHLGSCVITANLQEMRNGFSGIRDSAVCESGPPPTSWLPLPFSACPSLAPGSLAVRSHEEASWGLPTRRMHSQETSVARNLSVLERDTAHWAGSRRGWDVLMSRHWQPSLTYPFLPCLLPKQAEDEIIDIRILRKTESLQNTKVCARPV